MKKLICSVMAIIMALSLCIPAVAADETTSGEMLEAQNAYGLSTEAVDFLEAHDVDLSIFAAAPACYSNDQEIPLSMDSAVLSLIQQTEAYDFTDEQVQQYVDGLVHSDPIVVPRDGSSPYAVTNAPNSNYRSDGPGFEVQSNSGFKEATAYVTLPTAYNVVTNGEGRSNSWIFYTVSNGNWGIDVGLAYSHGTGGNGWRGCYTAQSDPNGTQCGPLISSLKAGSRVYFDASIESSGYLRFRVLDANDFSKCYYDISYYVLDHGIRPANGRFNRQITMTSNQPGDNKNGSYMRNASFSDAYLYSTSSYSKTNASNTMSTRRGLLQFGSKQLATVNSYTPWYAENISISFS